MTNPFIALYEAPIRTLGTLAYVLFLLGCSIGLAGLAWSTVQHILNVWEFRNNPNKFGPSWTYVPPLGLFWRVSGLCIVASVEALLFATLVYIVA